MLRLVNFEGCILPCGPPVTKLFSVVKMSSKDSFGAYLKRMYIDRKRHRGIEENEENVPNFLVDLVELL